MTILLPDCGPFVVVMIHSSLSRHANDHHRLLGPLEMRSYGGMDISIRSARNNILVFPDKPKRVESNATPKLHAIEALLCQ